MVSLGDSLKKARKQAGFTQEQLAERVGVSRGAKARYEAGEIEPSLKTLVLLADTLRVSTDDLLGRERPSGYALEDLSPQAVRALEEFIRVLKNGSGTETERGEQSENE